MKIHIYYFEKSHFLPNLEVMQHIINFKMYKITALCNFCFDQVRSRTILTFLTI